MARNSTRPLKGKSLLCFPDNYVSVDIETTGLSPEECSIIEIGAVRVTDHVITDRFDMLIHNRRPLDPFIVSLTGITDDMLRDAPDISTVLAEFADFIRTDDILVGHNVNFDINFLYDNLLRELGYPLSNDFADTLRISKKLFPELPNYRLSTLITAFGVSENVEHRALSDCTDAHGCLEYMRRFALEKDIDISKKARKKK